MAYVNVLNPLASQTDVTTIRGVDTTERIFYISPYWINELLIQNNGTNNIYIRLSKKHNPLTIPPGGEVNLNGEIAYFLAKADGTQNIDILYKPTKKPIAKRTPPVGLYFDGIDDFLQLTKTITLTNYSLQTLVQVNGVTKSLATKYQPYIWDNYHQFRLAGGGHNSFQGWIYDKTKIWKSTGFYNYSLQNIYLPTWVYDNTTGVSKFYIRDNLHYSSIIHQIDDLSFNLIYKVKTNNWYYHGLSSLAYVYNRPISDQEVKHNYTSPFIPIQKGLVLYLSPYSIDIVNSKWYDLSGNENHATLYGPSLKELWRPEQ